MLSYLTVAILGYLLGSINTSIAVGRLWKKVDIRELGSGNAGATNTLRSLGIGPTVIVVLGDVLKGVLAVTAGGLLTDSELGKMLGGLAVVLGHNWPVFFGFKGGKGILTSAAVVVYIAPYISVFVVIISVLIIALARYVSLGSLAGALLFPALVVVMEPNNTGLLVFAALLALLAVYRHRGNIERLVKGTERKLGEKNKID